MQTKAMTSEQVRKIWGEVLDGVLGGDMISITRHNRPIAVVISNAAWEQILADYERLDDAEDLLAVYRSEIKKLRGKDDSTILTDKEADEWLTEDEPIPA